MLNLCAPAIIYLIFSITQILIDTFKGLYENAFTKGIITIMVTFLLNILCEKGLSMVAWLIVFIPFILMSVIVGMLLYIFGTDVLTGEIDSSYNYANNDKIVKYDSSGNIIIYDPEYNAISNPVYYQSPNIIVPNPNSNDTITQSKYIYVPNGSSSPEYQS